MKRLGVATIVVGILLLVVPIASAYLVQIHYDLLWNIPGTTDHNWVECSVEDPDSAKLIEHVRVERVGDHVIVLDVTLDTGIRGLSGPGTDLAIENPFVTWIETDDFGAELHEVYYCHHWEVSNGICNGTPILETTAFCLMPFNYNNWEFIEVDDDCCWLATTFTGTSGINTYLPLIMMQWSYPPVRP